MKGALRKVVDRSARLLKGVPRHSDQDYEAAKAESTTQTAGRSLRKWIDGVGSGALEVSPVPFAEEEYAAISRRRTRSDLRGDPYAPPTYRMAPHDDLSNSIPLTVAYHTIERHTSVTYRAVSPLRPDFFQPPTIVHNGPRPTQEWELDPWARDRPSTGPVRAKQPRHRRYNSEGGARAASKGANSSVRPPARRNRTSSLQENQGSASLRLNLNKPLPPLPALPPDPGSAVSIEGSRRSSPASSWVTFPPLARQETSPSDVRNVNNVGLRSSRSSSLSSLGIDILHTPSSLSSSHWHDRDFQRDVRIPSLVSFPQGKGKGKSLDPDSQELHQPNPLNEQPRLLQATCGICYSEFQSVYDPISVSLAPSGSADPVAYGTTLGCNDKHTYCLPCLTSYIRTALERENGGPAFPVRCPECPRRAQWEVDDDLATRLLDSELLERWFFQRLVAFTEVFYCPNPKCSEPISYDPDDMDVAQAECPSCHMAMCFRCKTAWHPDVTCDYNKDPKRAARAELLLKQLAEAEHWRSCPKCRNLVERTQGCAHMTCRCGSQFCLLCGSPWSGGCSYPGGCPNTWIPDNTWTVPYSQNDEAPGAGQRAPNSIPMTQYSSTVSFDVPTSTTASLPPSPRPVRRRDYDPLDNLVTRGADARRRRQGHADNEPETRNHSPRPSPPRMPIRMISVLEYDVRHHPTPSFSRLNTFEDSPRARPTGPPTRPPILTHASARRNPQVDSGSRNSIARENYIRRREERMTQSGAANHQRNRRSSTPQQLLPARDHRTRMSQFSFDSNAPFPTMLLQEHPAVLPHHASAGTY